jgi:hypothetical protein
MYKSLPTRSRYLIDGLQRLMGRVGRIKNDPQYICRALSVLPVEHHLCHSALSLLIDQGFLIPATSANDISSYLVYSDLDSAKAGSIGTDELQERLRTVTVGVEDGLIPNNEAVS